MIDSAVKDLSIDVENSYLIGDKSTDMELAHRVGAKAILVKTGYGEEELKYYNGCITRPDYIANDLYEAVYWIQRMENGKK